MIEGGEGLKMETSAKDSWCTQEIRKIQTGESEFPCGSAPDREEAP